MAKSKTTPIDSSLRNRTTLTGAFVIAAIALIVNANTFDHGYVLDDLSAITENWVTQKGTESLGTIWTTNYRHGYWSEPGSIYRPLTLSLFAWEWEHWPTMQLHFRHGRLMDFTDITEPSPSSNNA